jgi:hypothetical protein
MDRIFRIHRIGFEAGDDHFALIRFILKNPV